MVESYPAVSLHVAPRNTRRGGTYIKLAFLHVTIVTSEPSLLKTNLSLTVKGNNFAYFTLNDAETRFFIVSERWEEKLISRSIGSYFGKKNCEVYFLESLYPCCQSNLELAQPPVEDGDAWS